MRRKPSSRALIALTAVAAALAAVTAFATSKPNVRGLAIVGLIVALLLAIAKARGEWKQLVP